MKFPHRHLWPEWDGRCGLGEPFLGRGEQGAGAEQEGMRAHEEGRGCMGARLCWTPAPSARPLQAGGHQTCHVGGVSPLSTRALTCLFGSTLRSHVARGVARPTKSRPRIRESDFTVGRDPRDRVRSPGGVVEKIRRLGIKRPGLASWLWLSHLMCGIMEVQGGAVEST